MKTYCKIIDGISFITVDNEIDMIITLSTFGASVYDLKFKDKNNKIESIVLTPTELTDFYKSDGYYGKTIGRFSGRIDKAKCIINEKEYVLDKNWNGVNSLHGGYEGISFQNFNYTIEEYDNKINVIFTYLEKENLLPGDVFYKITYEIMKNKNDINLLFNAVTNKDTVVNLTNHMYFNLSGDLKNNIKEHDLQLLCDKYTDLNNELITKSIKDVDKIFDFRIPHKIGKYIYDEKLQNHTSLGYDHCWLKSDINEDIIAVLTEDKSGRKLSVSTSYPSIVCYAGCYPKEFLFNENRVQIEQYHSICLECQFIPNGINMNNMYKAILKKDEEYNHFIKYSFEIMED